MPCNLLQVKLIESKLPWIEYNDAMKEFTEVKDRRRQADACLEARKRDFEESQQPLGYMPSLLTSCGSVVSSPASTSCYCSMVQAALLLLWPAGPLPHNAKQAIMMYIQFHIKHPSLMLVVAGQSAATTSMLRPCASHRSYTVLHRPFRSLNLSTRFSCISTLTYCSWDAA